MYVVLSVLRGYTIESIGVNQRRKEARGIDKFLFRKLKNSQKFSFPIKKLYNFFAGRFDTIYRSFLSAVTVLST